MKLLKFLGAQVKKLSAVLLSALLLTLVLSPMATKADEQGPVFNVGIDDQPIIRGVNRTTQPDDHREWDVVTNGVPGQKLTGLVYYHNSWANTVAENTSVGIKINQGQGNAVIEAAISADNATTVTDTIVNGNIVGGRHGLLVNMPANTHLEFELGSVKWFPDAGAQALAHQDDPTWDDYQEMPLPYGQNGDSILADGVRLGNINGCYEFSGFVTFRFIIKPNVVIVPVLTLDKLVRNYTTNTGFVKENTAIPGDTLEYQIKIENTTDADASNVIVNDVLPANVSYVPDSATITRGDGTVSNLPDTLFGKDGIRIPVVYAHEVITIKFRVSTNHQLADQELLKNTAYIAFDQNLLSSEALTRINAPVVPTPKAPPAPTPQPQPELPKTGADNLLLGGLAMIAGGIGRTYLKYRGALNKMIALR